MIVKAIPKNIKVAIGSAIGFYIACLGFKNSGIGIFTNGIGMGNFKEPAVFIALLGLILIAILTAYRVNGVILTGIIAVTVMGIPLGVTTLPDTFIKMPDFSSWGNIVFSFDFKGLLSLQAIIYVFIAFCGDFSPHWEPCWERPARQVCWTRTEHARNAHEHIESSMMTPGNFAKAVIPKGTITVITDPHEIGNVWGIEGVRYMHEASQDLPLRQLIDIPSCVPAVPGLEHAGAEFGPEAIEELAKLERVVGLAEVMDYLVVIHGGDRMMDIIRTAEDHGFYLQGHAPFVEGRMLSAYLCRGPNTCHESRTAEEAVEKMRSGMRVDAREADDILHNGHINDVVRAAIRYGMEPVAAIKSTTLNSAGEAGLQNLGAIAPGYAADMLLVDDLRELTPRHVFYGGKLVALYHPPARIPGKGKGQPDEIL